MRKFAVVSVKSVKSVSKLFQISDIWDVEVKVVRLDLGNTVLKEYNRALEPTPHTVLDKNRGFSTVQVQFSTVRVHVI